MSWQITKRDLGAFACLAIAVVTAGGQSRKPDIEAETKAFATELAHVSSVRDWLAIHGPQLTREHAVAAERKARQLGPRNAEAYPYSAFAMYAFQYLGDNARSLENRVDERDLSFAVADTPERYGFIRNTVLQSSAAAVHIGRPDLAFAFDVLAADCSFYASTTKPGGTADEPLYAALSDEAGALKEFQAGFNRLWLERLVNLTVATIRKAQQIVYFGREKEKSDALFRRLSAAVDLSIPADFEYTSADWGNRKSSILSADILAGLSYRFGDASMARKRIAAAAGSAKQMGDQPLWLGLLCNRYAYERVAGTPPDRLRSLRDDARNGSQDLRAAYRSRPGRIWAGHHADQLYGDMLRDQLSESSELTDADFSFAEALKARTLLDALSFPPAAGPASADVSALERRALAFPLAAIVGSGTADVGAAEYRLISHLSFFYEDTLEAFGNDPSPREQAIAQLETAFRKTEAGFHSVAVPAHLAEVQQSLGPREAVLEYVIPYHRSHPAFDLYILFITHSAARTLHVALNEVLPFNVPMVGRITTNQGTNEYSQIGQTVVEMRTAIQDGDDRSAKSSLRDLYKVLIQPLTDQKVRLEDFDRLIIVPHGPLHYVPFAALLDGQGKYLISKTAIAVAPSASLWLTLTRRSRPVRHFVGFGSPDLTGRGMGELQYAAQEVTDIAKLLTAEHPAVFLGREATEDRFVREAKSADILHIATHGKFPDDDAMDLHEIMLTKGTSGDGGLRAARVRTLSLPSTSLVVLSVCNGGLYRMGPADEPYGLVPAFLEAGSQNVLGTLWKLDDQFGESFMECFYRHVMRDGPAEAYRKACLHFLAGNEDLRNWAAFVLVGPGRPFASQRN